MNYPFVPYGVLLVFAIYILYIVFIQRDFYKLREMIFPAVCFILLGAVVYLFFI